MSARFGRRLVGGAMAFSRRTSRRATGRGRGNFLMECLCTAIMQSASGRSAARFSAPAWGAGGRRFKSARPDWPPAKCRRLCFAPSHRRPARAWMRKAEHLATEGGRRIRQAARTLSQGNQSDSSRTWVWVRHLPRLGHPSASAARDDKKGAYPPENGCGGPGVSYPCLREHGWAATMDLMRDP